MIIDHTLIFQHKREFWFIEEIGWECTVPPAGTSIRLGVPSTVYAIFFSLGSANGLLLRQEGKGTA